MSILPDKVLLATDGSDDAALAATAAVDLSKSTGAELQIVHARRPLPHDAYPSLVPERYQVPYEEGARRVLEEQVGASSKPEAPSPKPTWFWEDRLIRSSISANGSGRPDRGG